jgi:acetyltransferase
MIDLKYLFSPHSLAVVGASTKEHSVGRSVLDNLRLFGFKGPLFPVNPKTDNIDGLKCYPNLSAIGQKIDLAIIIVPALSVATVLREAGILGIRAAIIISAGFKDAGRNDLEREINLIAKQYHIAVLGPNCLGMIIPSLKLNASFTTLMPKPGALAVLSQSGALGTSILDNDNHLHLGFSLFASVGNKAVLDEADFLQYLRADKSTEVIGIYAENLARPRKLAPLIKKLSCGANPKPVVVLKSGRTLAGASASSSHTGAIAGNDAVYEAFLKQSGAIRARNTTEFFDYLQIFSKNKLQTSDRLAIITNAGGPGVLAIDTASESSLSLAKLSLKTKASLSAILPPAASKHNPIDILGDASPERFRDVLEIVAADRGVHSILILLTPQSMTRVDEVAEFIIDWRRRSSKSLAVCFMGASLVSAAVDHLRLNKVATFDYPENAVKALGALASFSVNRSAILKRSKAPAPKLAKSAFAKVDKIFDQARKEDSLELPEFKALPVFEAYGLPVPDFLLIRNEREAKKASKHFSDAVALKIASVDILHKSEMSGISLDILPKNIPDAYSHLLARVKHRQADARIEGVLVAPMAEPGLAEMIIGAVKDPNLGHALMIGWGGIYTEIIRDAAFGLSPLSRDRINSMIDSLKISKILAGARGAKTADRESLVDIMLRLDALLRDFPDIKEIDLNPVIIREKGALVLDARILLS